LNWVERAVSPGELAKDFGRHATSIMNWVRRHEEARGVAPVQSGALSTNERQELIELRRKLSRVRLGGDILVKACFHGLPTTATRRQPARALIAANQAELPVRTMCKTLKVSANGFGAGCSARCVKANRPTSL
jgi:transposase-like protein